MPLYKYNTYEDLGISTRIAHFGLGDAPGKKGVERIYIFIG